MKIGLIGLGKMGLNLALNMHKNNINVVGYDIDKKNRDLLQEAGAAVAESLEDLLLKLDEKKIVWMMLPSGKITNDMILKLSELLLKGDIVLDGGNSNYKDTLNNNEILNSKGIEFLDVGSSGGVSGAKNGLNLMIGGNRDSFMQLENVFKKVSTENGYLYTGNSGSGHYLKMVHNGIEYGMMQAIGEGFELLEYSDYEYNYNEVCQLWNNGSVIRSWLIELAGNAFSKDSKLEQIKGIVNSSGEGKWMIEDALDRQVSIPIISSSLMMRYRSLREDTFSGKVVASLRNEFGGHSVEKK